VGLIDPVLIVYSYLKDAKKDKRLKTEPKTYTKKKEIFFHSQHMDFNISFDSVGYICHYQPPPLPLPDDHRPALLRHLPLHPSPFPRPLPPLGCGNGENPDDVTRWPVSVNIRMKVPLAIAEAAAEYCPAVQAVHLPLMLSKSLIFLRNIRRKVPLAIAAAAAEYCPAVQAVQSLNEE
jgi:hypothetical protein